jgi:Fe-S cluster assembly scaffold protein SufB
VDEGAYVHYVEGCTAPIYSSDSLHSAVVEIVVKKGGRCRYTTIQNWSNNVYNLVTKRASDRRHTRAPSTDAADVKHSFRPQPCSLHNGRL